MMSYINSIVQVSHHHKHLWDTLLAVTGIGSFAATLVGFLHPIFGFFVTLASLYLIIIRIQVAVMEKRALEEKKNAE